MLVTDDVISRGVMFVVKEEELCDEYLESGGIQGLHADTLHCPHVAVQVEQNRYGKHEPHKQLSGIKTYQWSAYV